MGRISARTPQGVLVVDQRKDQVLLLDDLNGDGDAADAGETAILGSERFGGPLERPRAVAFHEGAPAPLASTLGAGNHFSVFLDREANTLYSTGENVVGQLGNGATGFDVKTPRPVLLPEGFDEAIVSVSGGLTHTTFLTDAGRVYAFGFNNRGPLGLGDEETRTVATPIEGAFGGERVVGIENGNGVSFAITETGALHAWGNNANGQLGLGDLGTRLAPARVEALSGETVVAVSSGTAFTLALTARGEVWAFGANRDGQLGSPDALGADGQPLTRVPEPVRVAGLPGDIVAVTADTNTAYAVTSDGRVFGWGESRFGQLLRGADRGDGTFAPDPADALAPVELTALPPGVVDVKGGARWGAALTAEGDVYAWGPNDEGPTGGLDGDPEAESDASFYPMKIAALDGVTVVELETGPNSLLARDDAGRLYGWGSNPDGRLGFASDGPVYVPQPIALEGDAPPWLVSAEPADNARGVETDATLELRFTEVVVAGEGALRLVDRDTGEVTEIPADDARLVAFDGDRVTVTPPEHLAAGARYAVEIEAGAFLDRSGQPYPGIAEGDVTTFNFAASETAAPSERLKASVRADLLRGGADDDRIAGGFGDDIVSGGAGDDILRGDFGDDLLLGGPGDDLLLGVFGDDDLRGGAGDDVLRGGLGRDTLAGGVGDDTLTGGPGRDLFVFDAGQDVVTDFRADIDVFRFTIRGDRLRIDLDGFDTAESVLGVASQRGRDVVLAFDDETTLTLARTDLTHLDADHFLFG